MWWKKNRVTSCIITHFFLKTCLELTRPVLRNRKFSTDRDKTLTRHDFRPWFIRVLNLKCLAQLLQTRLACTKCLVSEKSLKSTIFKVLQNRQFSTDRDETTPSYQTRVHKVPYIKRDRQRDGQTDRQTDGQTDGQAQPYIPSFSWGIMIFLS